MKEIVLKNIKTSININELFNKHCLTRASDQALTVEQLHREIANLIRPKAVLKEAYITARGDNYVIVDNIKLTSYVLQKNLANAYKVYPFIVTCGIEVEEWSRSLNSFLSRYWGDVIKEQYLLAAMDETKEYTASSFGLKKISTMNPGSLEDWKLSQQAQLFSIIGDVQGLIGVKLTENNIMFPIKSISGIIFPSEFDFVNCQLCTRESCPGRKAPFDDKLYQQYFISRHSEIN